MRMFNNLNSLKRTFTICKSYLPILSSIKNLWPERTDQLLNDKGTPKENPKYFGNITTFEDLSKRGALDKGNLLGVLGVFTTPSLTEAQKLESVSTDALLFSFIFQADGKGWSRAARQDFCFAAGDQYYRRGSSLQNQKSLAEEVTIFTLQTPLAPTLKKKRNSQLCWIPVQNG